MQTGILKPVPLLATYLSFNLKEEVAKASALACLKQLLLMADGQRTIVGLSAALCKTLGVKAPKQLRSFKTPTGGKLKLPETSVDLLVWLRATPAQDRGDLLTIGRQVQTLLGNAFVLTDAVEAFKHLRKSCCHRAQIQNLPLFDLWGFQCRLHSRLNRGFCYCFFSDV